MAGLGRKVFTAGDVLTASDVQNYLMDQTVMNFAGTAARSSAIATPTTGMVCYRQDIDAVEAFDGTYWQPVNRNIISYTRDITALLTLTTGTETALYGSQALIPTPNRLYEVTYTIGLVQKTTSVGNIDIRLRKDNTSGTELDRTLYSAQNVDSVWTHSKTVLLTSTQMGTTSFIPTVTVQTNTNGAYFENTSLFTGAIMVKDIGPA